MSSQALRSRRFARLARGLLACQLLSGAAAAQSVSDPNLHVTTIANGTLSSPTAMAFLGPGDLLVLEKSGSVRRILNGVLQPTPVLSVPVNDSSEHGLLGIAINSETPRKVFLYMTESATPGGSSIANRVYRYSWNPSFGTLNSRLLVLDLPVTPGPNHDGGALLLGPPGQAPGVGDGALLYAVIGDLNRVGKLQNVSAGAGPDDTSVILRVRQDGTPAPGNPFKPYCMGATTQLCSSDLACGSNGPCALAVSRYYAYGVRNCFGMAIEPLGGRLWDTENGDNDYDEVNRVAPGFNSGWTAIMGPDARDPQGVGNLWNVPGAGSTYSDPEFSWLLTVAPTAIVFPFGSNLGSAYDNMALVGDFNFGALYALPLNGNRDGFDFSHFPNLADGVADNYGEGFDLAIGTDFNGISDLEIGPDGQLYVLSIAGSLYRITGPGRPPVPALSAAGFALLGTLLAGTALVALSGRRES